MEADTHQRESLWADPTGRLRKYTGLRAACQPRKPKRAGSSNPPRSCNESVRTDGLLEVLRNKYRGKPVNRSARNLYHRSKPPPTSLLHQEINDDSTQSW